jgi:hypothetical protein
MGYDGAVDGARFFHGVVVETEMPSGRPGEQAATHAARSSQSLQPEHELDIEPLIRQAIRVIGSHDAMRWMGTPVRALGFATPISLLVDQSGREQVVRVLEDLEHGVL